MPNDIWTPPTNWNAGTDFTEAKAEQEITDDMYVLSLAIDGDSCVSRIKHRHLAGINAARPVAGEAIEPRASKSSTVATEARRRASRWDLTAAALSTGSPTRGSHPRSRRKGTRHP